MTLKGGERASISWSMSTQRVAVSPSAAVMLILLNLADETMGGGTAKEREETHKVVLKHLATIFSLLKK